MKLDRQKHERRDHRTDEQEVTYRHDRREKEDDERPARAFTVAALEPKKEDQRTGRDEQTLGDDERREPAELVKAIRRDLEEPMDVDPRPARRARRKHVDRRQ